MCYQLVLISRQHTSSVLRMPLIFDYEKYINQKTKIIYISLFIIYVNKVKAKGLIKLYLSPFNFPNTRQKEKKK